MRLLDPLTRTADLFPSFGCYKSIPESISGQLEEAVRDFIQTSHVPKGVDLKGFYNQTLQAIAQYSILNQVGDLWLAIYGGVLWGYVLAHFGQDIDGRLTYTVTQAWVKKDQRNKPWVHWGWQRIRQRAKTSFCGHLMVISTRRNDEAYCRFLGSGFHKYASLLKEEL